VGIGYAKCSEFAERLTIDGEWGIVGNMESKFLFVQSAFKHGVTRIDIQKAIATKVYDGPLGDQENKYAILGFDAAGNPLEVFYNIIDDETIKIFHAMRCRNMVISQLGL
jgi:hypothetical protein